MKIDEIKRLFYKNFECNTLDQGVLYGNTALAILTGVLYKQTNDSCFKNVFQNCIDKISGSIENMKNIDFERGIAGIGWGIEWLCQNGILKYTNTDIVLEDFDDLLYRCLIYKRGEDYSILNGDLGQAYYFILRVKSKNMGTHRFRKLVNRECLSILEDRLQEYLKVIAEKDKSLNDIITLSDILKIISPLYNVLNSDRESLLNSAISIAYKTLLNVLDKENCIKLHDLDQLFCYLYLSTSLLYAAININSHYFKQKIEDIIRELFSFVEKHEISPFSTAFFKLVYIRFSLALYEKNEQNLVELRELITRFDTKITNQLASLHNMSIYIYAILYLMNDDLPYKLQELIFYPLA